MLWGRHVSSPKFWRPWAETAPTEEEASNLKRVAAAVRRAAPGVVRGIAVAGLSAGARAVLGI